MVEETSPIPSVIGSSTAARPKEKTSVSGSIRRRLRAAAAT